LIRQSRQRRAYVFETQSNRLRDADKGNAAQDVPGKYPPSTCAAGRIYQSLRFIKAQGTRRNPGSLGQRPYGYRGPDHTESLT
jgi:hypothetical protein